MGKLILADNAPFNPIEEYFVKVPSPRGYLMVRNDAFLNEMTCLSEGEIAGVIMDVVPHNPKLGVVDDAIALATETIDILKNVINGIKSANVFNGKPPAVPGYQYPGKDKVLADVKAGLFTYENGHLNWGPNHPLVKKKIYEAPLGVPPVPVGTFFANMPDEIIQALDPKYIAAVNNLANLPATNTPKFNLQNFLPGATTKGITVNTKPGGGLTIGTTEWYQSPWIWVGGAAALFGLYKLATRTH
jgi:hypothetical protein